MIGAPDAVVTFVVPDGLDDAERVSGGNVYDQHVRDGLRRRGREVRMLSASPGGEADAASAFASIGDGELILVDGLIAVEAPEAISAESARLRLCVIAHMVAGSLSDPDAAATIGEREGAALGAARVVIATSEWTRSELIERDLVDAHRVVVARPGTDPATRTRGSATGGRLLCLGAIAPHKGHDLLVRALSELGDSDDLGEWSCTIAGSLTVDPDFVADLASAIAAAGLDHRITLTGVLTGRRLADTFASTDLLVAPSRTESYGMAIADALAHGIPVLATRTGGIPEAVADSRAGILVPSDDAWALRIVLHRWLTDASWRTALKTEAVTSRGHVRSWDDALDIIEAALASAALSETVGARSARQDSRRS